MFNSIFVLMHFECDSPRRKVPDQKIDEPLPVAKLQYCYSEAYLYQARVPYPSIIPHPIPLALFLQYLPSIHAKPPLHLRMEIPSQGHLLLPMEHLFPPKLSVPPLQNIRMQPRGSHSASKDGRPPLARPHNREFHLALHGLCDSELAAQELHF